MENDWMKSWDNVNIPLYAIVKQIKKIRKRKKNDISIKNNIYRSIIKFITIISFSISAW